jgi:hypothetical protein
MASYQNCESTSQESILGSRPSDLRMSQGTWQFMSTRLLTAPGSVHELRDDLESHWFVLLYEALHFVKHNKPFGVRMGILFDQVDVCEMTGIHTGGVGKIHLYSKCALMTKRLVFECKPFNALVRQVYQLFQSLNSHYEELDKKVDPEEEDPNTPIVRKLSSCAEMERLFQEALNAEGWPDSCDKVEDQYPPLAHLTPEQKNIVALSHVNHTVRQPGEPSGTKRKREEEDPPVFENKRVKVDPLWKRILSRCARLVRPIRG